MQMSYTKYSVKWAGKLLVNKKNCSLKNTVKFQFDKVITLLRDINIVKMLAYICDTQRSSLVTNIAP